MRNNLKTFFNSKTFYVILSIALALFAWMMVLSYTNPIQTRTLEIQIKFLNEGAPANLDLKDQTVTYPKTATVTVSGRQDTLNNLTSSELQATVDLSEITSAGKTELRVSKPTCDRLGVSIEDYYPKTIEFTYDTFTQKNLDIRIEYDQSILKEGYEFISVTSTLSSIPISGFASLLESCDHIQVNLTDSIAAGTLDSDRTAAFLGRYISVTGEDITHQFSSEQITVNIRVAKKVPLVYTITGTPNANYYLNSDTVSPSYVLLVGPTSVLNEISSIYLGQVSVNGATKTLTKEFRLADYLPAGVSLYEAETAQVTAEIMPYQTRTFHVNLDSINTPGKDDMLYDYEISPQSYTISIKGRQDDLASLTLASLGPTLDLRNKTIGGYQIPLTFTSLDPAKFTLVGEYVFAVNIQQKQEDTPLPEDPTPEMRIQEPVAILSNGIIPERSKDFD